MVGPPCQVVLCLAEWSLELSFESSLYSKSSETPGDYEIGQEPTLFAEPPLPLQLSFIEPMFPPVIVPLASPFCAMKGKSGNKGCSEPILPNAREKEPTSKRVQSVSGGPEHDREDGSDRQEDTLQEEDAQDRVRELGAPEAHRRLGQQLGEESPPGGRERREERVGEGGRKAGWRSVVHLSLVACNIRVDAERVVCKARKLVSTERMV